MELIRIQLASEEETKGNFFLLEGKENSIDKFSDMIYRYRNIEIFPCRHKLSFYYKDREFVNRVLGYEFLDCKQKSKSFLKTLVQIRRLLLDNGEKSDIMSV